MRDRKKLDIVPASPARSLLLTIDIGSADPDIQLPKIGSQLFYRNFDEAMQKLPDEVRSALQSDPSKPRPRTPGLKLPKLLRTVDPEFSDEDRGRAIDGTCEFTLFLDEAAHISAVWLTKALGYGLDEMAAKAVWSYVFEPATMNGAPVPTTIAVEVRYRKP